MTPFSADIAELPKPTRDDYQVASLVGLSKDRKRAHPIVQIVAPLEHVQRVNPAVARNLARNILDCVVGAETDQRRAQAFLDDGGDWRSVGKIVREGGS